MTVPAAGGTYVLAIGLSSKVVADIGRLGRLEFLPGLYAYVGSAHGPGGLAARIGRYVRGPARKHWHVDYFLEHVTISDVFFRADAVRRECQWAAWVGERAKGLMSGFGSSDCRCPSHLFFIGSRGDMEQMIRAAGCELQATRSVGGR